MSNGKWYLRGKDGKFYEDENELIAADNRWNQQQQQNELLAQQNELIAKQKRDNERLAWEQMNNQKQIENSRQRHEKEMRLLSLCDEVGISKNIIDSFINYLISDDVDDKEVKKNNKLIKKLDCDFDNHITDKQINLLISAYKHVANRNPNEMHSIEFYSSYDIDDVAYESIRNKLDNIPNNSGTTEAIWLIGFISIVISFGFENFVLIFIILVTCIVLTGLMASMKENQINAIYTEINNICNERIEQLKKTKHGDKSSDEILKQKSILIDRNNEIIEKVVYKKLEDFYKFRVKHYNRNVEKFLLDYDFKSKIHPNIGEYNISFESVIKSITKSQAKGTGDIDDYIDYFNTVISKNEKEKL